MGEFFPRGNFVLPTKWKIKIDQVFPAVLFVSLSLFFFAAVLNFFFFF